MCGWQWAVSVGTCNAGGIRIRGYRVMLCVSGVAIGGTSARMFKCRLKSVILGMACHETVSCPRCERTFECRVGTILRCQCQDVVLTEEERYFIQQHYNGCLCADCLLEMQAIYRQPEASS